MTKEKILLQKKYSPKYVPQMLLNDEFVNIEQPHKQFKVLEIVNEYVEIEGYDEEIGYFLQKDELPCYKIEGTVIFSILVAEHFDKQIKEGLWKCKNRSIKVISLDSYRYRN